MRIKLYLVLLFTLSAICREVPAQTVLLPAQTVWQYAAGVAGWTYDAFGSLRHPAMSVSNGRMVLGVSAESMSGIPGTAMLSSIAGRTIGSGVLAFGFDHRSQAGSGETRFVFGYSLPLSSNLRAGLRLGHQGLRVPGHRLISGWPVEWGLIYHQNRLSVGVAACHPVNISPRSVLPGIPAIFRIAATLEVSAGSGLAVEVVREEGWGLSCRPMVFYLPSPSLKLCAGLVADKGSAFLGIRYGRPQMGATFFFDRHPLLGWTGAVGIDFHVQRDVE